MLRNVNKVSCLFTKVKKIKVEVTEAEEIEGVKNALKWPHFVNVHAPVSKIKRNLAFSLLELGKNDKGTFQAVCCIDKFKQTYI